MADNVTLPATGEIVATDDIAGAQYQRIKVTDGLADSALPMRVQAVNPLADAAGAVVRQAPADMWTVTFGRVGSALMETDRMTQRRLGTGMGVSQASGSLLLTTGTSTNSEWLARSNQPFRGAFLARHRVTLSQRIANNNFVAMLADLIGEGLSCTINSATSITVTIPSNPFTAANVGQSMLVGAITNAAGVPGRYTIASVSGNDVTFNVANWPASGSCTVDLFGWNYIRTVYSGTTPTNANVDAQRNGWNSGDTTATINSTASPGHLMQVYADGRNINWSDTLVASGTTPAVTTRASRVENLPDDDVALYFYLWSYNGVTAPASTTTWTIGHIAVEDMANVPMFLAGVRPLGAQAALPVAFPAAQAVTVSSGTVTTVSTLSAISAGANLIADVGQQYRANSTGAATLTNVNCPATPAAQQIKGSAGRLINISLTNTANTPRWVKLFNLLSASVTPGTTAALAEIAIHNGTSISITVEGGMAFSTGISIMITGGQGLTNNTAVTAGDVTGLTLFA